MTWVKLGDEMPAAAEPLSDAAFRLHVEALAWSARHLLDLVVPFKHLPRFAYCAGAETAAEELVEAGWWEEQGDAWYIGLRWPEWQRPKEEVELERARNLERQHRRRKHLADDHSTCLPQSCPQALGVESTASRRDTRRESRRPDPTRPVPKGQGRVEGLPSLSRRDSKQMTRKPDRAYAVSEVDTLSDAGRAALRDRAIESLGDDLPSGWEHDESWESYIYGRMTKIMLDDLLVEHRNRQQPRRTGT